MCAGMALEQAGVLLEGAVQMLALLWLLPTVPMPCHDVSWACALVLGKVGDRPHLTSSS